jgi:uncharacterized membrane protein
MLLLILGIIAVLGVHSLTMCREARANLIASLGDQAYKTIYSILSIAGFALLVYGFHRYRQDAWMQVWTPPAGMRHLTILLMWFAFVAVGSMHRKPAMIAGWLRHPMLAGLKIWALAHLLANGDLGGMVLFGSFLAYAVVDRIAIKRRGDLGAARGTGFTRADAIALAAGTAGYIAMLLLHPLLIGVAVL